MYGFSRSLLLCHLLIIDLSIGRAGAAGDRLHRGAKTVKGTKREIRGVFSACSLIPSLTTGMSFCVPW